MRDAPQFLLMAIQQDIHILQYASNNLRHDRNFMLAAMQRDFRAVQYVSPELFLQFKEDGALMLSIVERAR